MKTPVDRELQRHDAIGRLEHGFDLPRRDFFKLLGGGLLVGVAVGHVGAQESGSGGRRQIPNDLDSWLHIGESGQVTVFTGKVEVGQNIRTSLAQQVAEELRVPFSSITMVMGDTDLTPYDMGTFGSRSTPQMGTQLRKAAASARVMLVQMAAERWQKQESDLVVEAGIVRDTKSRRTISYAELTRGQKLAKVIPDDPPETPPQKWKVAGASMPKKDARDFVTGVHKYASDHSVAGMLFGKVVRPNAFHASLVSCDTSAAERITGVTVVHDGDFVGVAAPDRATADRAAAAINTQWNGPSQPAESELFSYLKAHESKDDDHDDDIVKGSVEQARSQARKSLQQTYTVAYIQHVPLEPRAALAEWKDGKLTVWTGTQRPFGVRSELASVFHISESDVHVIMPDTGSAYGGKHTGEAAVEAARLAKAAGKPVKLTWTREEEFTWAYFRPAGVIEIKSGVKSDGGLIFWEHDNYNSGPSAMETPYDVENQRIAFHASDAPLRQGSYRSLAAAANHFARESHMDEVAHSLKMDPLEFRMKNLKHERLRAVFQAAADNFGWGKEKASQTRGFGVAGGIEKGGHVAACAEVEINHGEARVVRVVEGFDCGAVINPQGLKNQIAGAIVQGLGGALFEAIHFENGRILNPRLSEYRVPRFSDAPKIEVVLVDRKDQPSMGAGETPLIAVAPAVANAIFDATGIRLRSMPLLANGLPAKRS